MMRYIRGFLIKKVPIFMVKEQDNRDLKGQKSPEYQGKTAIKEFQYGLISDIYSGIKSKIQFISVAEDAVFTAPKCRTQEQVTLLSKVRPKHLVERIDQFKAEKNNIYQFEKYPEDEFWILTDVDQNWSSQLIDPQNAKTYKDEWDDAIAVCDEKGYHYAVSNPFF